MKRKVGNRFGRLEIVALAERRKGHIYWRCQCDCGAICIRADRHIASGRSLSCGCLQKELSRARRVTHGRTRTSMYWIHSGIMKRCYSPTCPAYQDYGGRGIEVCERWHRFENFLADMGERPSKDHSVDRIDNDGNYEPENCRWATRREQSENRKTTIWVTSGGVKQCLAAWARERGVNYGTVLSRVRSGWSPERAISEPVNVSKRNARASRDGC